MFLKSSNQFYATFLKSFRPNKTVTESFPKIPYLESMSKYGTDKPDLRNPIEMSDVTEIFIDSGFKIFAESIKKDNDVKSLGYSCKKWRD